MDVVILIGRILFGLVFVASAMGHLTQTAAMAAVATARGVPNAHLATRLSGVAIVLGALSVMVGVYPDLGALVLFVFLMATAFTVHTFWRDDADARMVTQTQFMKDVSLGGAALALCAIWAGAVDGSIPLTITGSLF